MSTPTASFEDAIDDADVVIVATNHSEFRDPRSLEAIQERAARDCLLVDPWDCLGGGRVFAPAAELAPRGEEARAGAGGAAGGA